MMETPVQFRAGEVILEGLLARATGDAGVIVSHPHPLYGGDMYNPVVETICRSYQEHLFTTLRFNFRGVGASEGHYNDTIGEGADILGAIAFLQNAGIGRLHLAGYSFGARVLGGLAEVPEPVEAQLHVAPPVAHMDYSTVTNIAKLRWVIGGEYDDIGPPEVIRKHLDRWNDKAQLRIISGADHFFSATMSSLQQTIKEIIAESDSS